LFSQTSAITVDTLLKIYGYDKTVILPGTS